MSGDEGLIYLGVNSEHFRVQLFNSGEICCFNEGNSVDCHDADRLDCNAGLSL